MLEKPRCALITSFTAKTRDRFHEYNEDRSFEQRLAMVERMAGIDGVEVVYPYECADPVQLSRLVSRHSLSIAAVNVNVKAEPEFRNGGLSSPDRAVRAKAVRFVKEAKDFARAAGANKVTCCPLADGYEFSFQCDYAAAWNNLVEALGEAGSYLPEIPLHIEYKPSETRGRCFIDTAAKTLCLLNDIGIECVGVTVDFGHSMYGNENPAEAVSLVAQSRFPLYIHINDNDARWDWDYMVATRHYLDYIEFLYYLQKTGYDDYLTSDTSPTRWDIVGTFEANARVTAKLWDLLTRLDQREFASCVSGGDYLRTWRFIEENIFRI